MIKMQIACLCVTLLLALYSRQSRYLNTRTSRAFRWMIRVVMLNLIFDIATVSMITYRDRIPIGLIRVMHVLFLWTVEAGLWLMLQYVMLVVDNERMNPKVACRLADIPLFAGMAVTALAPLKIVWSPAGTYYSGIPVYTSYVLVIYDLLLSAAMLIYFSKDVEHEKRQTVYPALTVTAVLPFIEFVMPTVFVSGLCMTIALLSIFLSRENPDEFYNRETGMFNENGFLKMIDENIHTREEFHLVLFTISNVVQIREKAGVDGMNLCLKQISAKIHQMYHHNCYALDDNELVFFAGSKSAAQANAAYMNEWLSQPLKMNGQEIHIETEMTAWDITKKIGQSAQDILFEIESYFTNVLAKFIYMDHFTGVMNRNAYERDLVHWNHHRGTFAAACSMVDLNHLKKMNDSCGHAAGDAMISSCAGILKHSMPKDARIYRIGGDEFAVLITGRTKEEVAEIFASMEQICAKMNKGKEHPLTFAVGTAFYDPKMDAGLTDTFARADKIMYERKEEMHLSEILSRSEDDWNWIREMDTINYESLLFHALTQITDSYLFIDNRITNMIRWSPNAVEDFGLDGEYVFRGARNWSDFIHPDDLNSFYYGQHEVQKNSQKHYQASYRIKNRWGEYMHVNSRGYLACDENGKGRLFIGVVTPVTRENIIDSETFLPGKNEFTARIEQLCTSGNETSGVLLLSMNDFRRVNMLYSYAVGDTVLYHVAEIIEKAAPSNSQLYRYGGDMFAVICPHIAREGLYELFEKIEKQTENFQADNGEQLCLTISGGALMLEKDVSADHVRTALEHAVMEAKQAGKGMVEYASDSRMEETAVKFRMREELRRCVRGGMEGFYLNFQPILNGADQSVFGCEALLRWETEEFGKVGPDQFIPVLEELGLIRTAGRWVISSALDQLKQWQKIKPDMTINVNVSYIQLQQPDLAAFIVGELRKRQLAPQSLIVEMTESCKVSNYDGVLEFVNSLHANGISFALDDFGTGYSSFEVMKKVPADWIKLEHSYVSSIGDSKVDRSIIVHIIAMCHSLGIRVCAEGVEDAECCASMQKHEAEYLQGYFISRPLSAEHMEEFLHDKIG